MKNIKKIIAVVLAVVMSISMVAVFASAEEPLNYLVLGDSIGWGAGVLNHDDACFGRIVANTNGYNYFNQAVNGHRTQDLLRRLDNETVAQDVAKADIISISIGGNDYLVNNMPALIAQAFRGNYAGFDEIIETSKANLADIIAKIKALNPDVVILLQTLYNPRNDDVHDAYQYAVELINAMVYECAEQNPGMVEVADVGSAFTGHIDEYIAADQIHPSADGNIAIAKVVLQKLYDLGLGTQTEPVLVAQGIEQMNPFMTKIMKTISALMMRIFKIFVTLGK